MSDEARAYVIEHSPYRGVMYLIHYMLADLANPTHHNELWIGAERLAWRCGRVNVRTIERARDQMVADGILAKIPTGPGVPKRYRFLVPGMEHSADTFVDAECTEVLPFVGERTQDASPECIELCHYLADAIVAFHDNPRLRPNPLVKSWTKPMQQLINRGPLHREAPEPLTPERIKQAINFVFTRLAEPKADGFCWAAQIRSPQALRDHWDQLLIAGAAVLRARVDPLDPGRWRQ